jgi:ABC-type multidrug transport system ATPase subunit
MSEALLTTGLTKRYPKAPRPAVNDMSFAIEPQEVVGLLGPNGAGKSTMIRMICGTSQPSAGSVSVFGFDPIKSPMAAKTKVAAMHQGAPLDAMLPAIDSLRIAARFRGISWHDVRPWVDEVTDFLGIRGALGQLAFQLSGGQKQRLQLARALLTVPQLLILDEPAAALDVAGRRLIWELVGWLREEYQVTVLWASHDINEIERNCDRALVIDKGCLVRFGRPRDLIEEFATAHVVAATRDEAQAEQIVTWARTVGAEPSRTGTQVSVQPGPIGDASDLIPALTLFCAGAGIALTQVSVETDSLESVFMRLTHAEEQTSVSA